MIDLRTLRPFYVQEARRRLQEARAYREQSDCAGIRRSFHTIRGMSAIMGVAQVMSLAAAGEEGQLPDCLLSEILATLEEQIRALDAGQEPAAAPDLESRLRSGIEG